MEAISLKKIDKKTSMNSIYIIVNDIMFRITEILIYYLIVMNFFILNYSIILYSKIYNDLILFSLKIFYNRTKKYRFFYSSCNFIMALLLLLIFYLIVKAESLIWLSFHYFY
jgi:hypothetical protein